MREKNYYGAIKGFCLKWNLPEVWNSDRITGANLIYEVIKVINAMIVELREYEERVDGKLETMLKMIEDFLKMFNEDLSETVLNILVEWKDSGMLEGIINDALFNQKLDKSVFESFIVTYEEYKITVDEKLVSLEEKQLESFEILENKIYNYQSGAHNIIYGDKVRNFMHRGLSYYLPENSFWAFDMAGFTGAKGLEIDLQMSLDKKFIVSHDDTLISMTDSNLIISQQNADVITALNVTKGKNVDKVPVSKMQTFEQVINTALKYDMKIIAEIKPDYLNHEDLQKLINILYSKNCVDRVALMSFDYQTLVRLRSLNESVVLGLVMASDVFNSDTIELLNNLGNSFASVNYVNVSTSINQQNLADLNNIPITFWTVNDVPASQDMVMFGVKSITTDRIKGSRPTMVTKAFMLNKTNGVVKVNNDFMPEFGYTYELANKNIMLAYVSPFVINNSDANGSFRRSIVQVAMSGSNALNYSIKGSGERNNLVELTLYNPEGNRVDFSTLPEGYYFNVTVVGWDFL